MLIQKATCLILLFYVLFLISIAYAMKHRGAAKSRSDSSSRNSTGDPYSHYNSQQPQSSYPPVGLTNLWAYYYSAYYAQSSAAAARLSESSAAYADYESAVSDHHSRHRRYDSPSSRSDYRTWAENHQTRRRSYDVEADNDDGDPRSRHESFVETAEKGVGPPPKKVKKRKSKVLIPSGESQSQQTSALQQTLPQQQHTPQQAAQTQQAEERSLSSSTHRNAMALDRGGSVDMEIDGASSMDSGELGGPGDIGFDSEEERSRGHRSRSSKHHRRRGDRDRDYERSRDYGSSSSRHRSNAVGSRSGSIDEHPSVSRRGISSSYSPHSSSGHPTPTKR